jgi:hypothetical protein
VILTAQMAIMIAGIAADHWRSHGGQPPSRTTARELMHLLLDGAVILPRPV